MITYRELVTSFRALGVESASPVIVHASLTSIGQVNGGVDALLGALLASFEIVVMPVYTYRCTLIPEVGPAENGIAYGSGVVSNTVAEFFRADMPADRNAGVVAESLRRLPQARRSSHPILSFSGVNADSILNSQSLAEPLAPVRRLLEAGGWVMLLGVDNTANISLHYAERLAGRKQFVRWALTPSGVRECPDMPGCSQGFNAITPRLRRVTRQAQAGDTVVQAVPLVDLIGIARAWLESDPLALLCDMAGCERCEAVRAQSIRV